MLNAKRLLLMLIISTSMKPVSIKADSQSEALVLVAGVAIVAVAGYGIYRLCEWSSFKHAQKKLLITKTPFISSTKNICLRSATNSLFTIIKIIVQAIMISCVMFHMMFKTCKA